MKILVVCARDKTLSCHLYSMDKEAVLFEGNVSHLGNAAEYVYSIHLSNKPITFSAKKNIHDHEHALEHILETLMEYDLHDVECVAHHVFHGGAKHSHPMKVTDALISQLHSTSILSAENGPGLICILTLQKLLQSAHHVAIFDTAFHLSMARSVYEYPLAKELAHEGLRKFGFLGVLHYSVAKAVRKLLLEKDHQRYFSNYKLISVHIGDVVNICAIENGKSVNVSMGASSLGGPIMPTRCGDIDPATMAYLMDTSGKTSEQITSLLLKKSGYLAYSTSSDLSYVHKCASEGSVDCEIIIEKLVADVARYIGGYICDLDGVDVVAFSGDATKEIWLIEKICEKLEFFGVSIRKPVHIADTTDVTGPESKVNILLVRTKPDLEIARDAKRLLEGR